MHNYNVFKVSTIKVHGKGPGFESYSVMHGDVDTISLEMHSQVYSYIDGL